MALGLDMRKHGVQSLLVHCSLYRRDAARDLLDETRGYTAWFAFTVDFTRIIFATDSDRNHSETAVYCSLLAIAHISVRLIDR